MVLGGLQKDDINERKKILKIMERHGIGNMFSCAMRDMENKPGCSFFAMSLASAQQYVRGPEIIRELAGESWVYSKIISDEDSLAFANGDYVTALNNVNKLMNKYNIDGEDRQAVIDYFCKALNKCLEGTYSVVFIPLKELYSDKQLESIKKEYLAAGDSVFNLFDLGFYRHSDEHYSGKSIKISSSQIVDISSIIPTTPSIIQKLDLNIVKMLGKKFPRNSN